MNNQYPQQSTNQGTEFQPSIPQSEKSMYVIVSFFIATAVFGGYLALAILKNWWPFESELQQVACTADAMLCPDGSYVGRTGPNCEFAPCATSQIEHIDTSTWKTYRNEEYGFEFRYPPDFFLKEQREFQDDALNPAETYMDVFFITNYPKEKETVRGPFANFNLTINFFRQAPESFASVVRLPLQTIILGTEVYKFVEYDEGLNYSGAGFRAKYFLATPLVKDTWITFDHLPINEGDGGDVFSVRSTGNFLDYLQQKQIARTILSTFKFTQ